MPFRVDRLAVDQDLAGGPVRAADDAGRGLLGALGEETDGGRRLRQVLDHDLLPQPAAMPSRAAGIRAEDAAVDAHRRELLDYLGRGGRDVARPAQAMLAVLDVRGPHAAVEEEQAGEGAPVLAHAGLGDRPERAAGARGHAFRHHLRQCAVDQGRHEMPGQRPRAARGGPTRVDDRAVGHVHLDRRDRPVVVR